MRSKIKNNTTQTKWIEKIRIILAITGKDIREALKNKSFVSIIFSAMFIVVAYRFLPDLSRGSDLPPVFVYSESETVVVDTLKNSDRLNVYTGYETLEAMQRRLADWDLPAIGVVLSDGLTINKSPDAVTLDAYVLNWASDEDNASLTALVESEFSELIGQPVQLNTTGHTVYLWPESDGISTWMGMSAVFAISMIGITLIPHLMLDEKKNRTIDFLLVSPATPIDLSIAKALTGTFYVVLAVIVVIAIYYYTVVQWWLVPIIILTGTPFLVGTGLFFGTLIKDRSQLTLVGFFIFIPLFLPVMLSLMTALFPEALITIFKLVPTTVLFNLFRTALSGAGHFSTSTVFWQSIYLLGWGVGTLMIVIALIRRMDRSESRYGPKARMAINDANFETAQVPSSGTGISTYVSENDASSIERVRPTPILAIALKDIREAINNKLFISILIGTGFIVISQSAMQNFIIRRASEPVLIAYDAGDSTVMQLLDQQPETRLYMADSISTMEEEITTMPSADLGLIIPDNFDELVAAQEDIVLQGYIAHWFEPAEAAQVRKDFEMQISEISNTPVQIVLDGNRVYPTLGRSSSVQMASIIMSISLLIVGMLLVPVLFVDEIESHTMQTLLVSPATELQIVVGKALAGIAYLLGAAVIVLLVNKYLVIHWGVVLAAIALVSLLAIGLGLLIGTTSKNSETINLWSAMLLLLLLGSAFVQILAGERLGDTWNAILDWTPGTMIVNLFQYSMVGEVPMAMFWDNVLGILGYCLAAFAIVSMVLKRKEKFGF